MSVGGRIRNCDLFGQQIGLSLEGQGNFKTLAGGFVSILVKTLIFAFFVLQLTAVYSFSDTQISSFKIFESRSDMQQVISLQEYGMRIYFSMTDKQSMPVPMDSRYGSFSLTTTEYWYTDEGL